MSPQHDQDAQSCVEPRDTFGFASAIVSGTDDPERGGDAYFGVDSASFYLTMSQPELGHFHLELKTPGRTGFPQPGVHRVGGSEITDGVAGFAAELTLFVVDSAYQYTPERGTVIITKSEPAGICGTFDMAWRAVAAEGVGTAVHTVGEFRAVQNRFTAGPSR